MRTYDEVKLFGKDAGRKWAWKAARSVLEYMSANRQRVSVNQSPQLHSEAERMYFTIHPDPSHYAELMTIGRGVLRETVNDFWAQFAGDIEEEWYHAFALGFVEGAIAVYDNDLPHADSREIAT